MSVFYYDGVLDKGPKSIHLWRQTDCLSMANQYMEGGSLWKPKMHIQLGDENTSGYSAGEFPILYYIVGNIWKLTGESYFVYRVFYLIIMFFGVFSFYLALRKTLGNNFWATTLSLLLYTSPIYIVYGVSFLTDAPAFSFMLIALYMIVQYHLEGKYKYFYYALTFIALAGLIKISSLIAFVFLGAMLVLESFSVKTLGTKKLYHGLKKEWIGYCSVVAVIFGWYAYASYFNSVHGFKYTFNNIFPVWLLSSEEMGEWWTSVRDFASYFFFHRSVIYLLVVAFVFNLFMIKKVPLIASLSSIIITCGTIFYLILWAPLIMNHDYYYIPVLILIAGVLTPVIWALLQQSKTLKFLAGIFMVFLLSYNFLYGLSMIKLRTLAEEGSFSIVQNKKLVNQLFWYNYDAKKWEHFEYMRPYLKELGVKKEDLVISLPDDSFSISLFLMRQKGWTNFNQYDKEEDIQELINKGAKYLMISDENTKQEAFLQPFLSNKIGEFNHITIYYLN